MDFSTIIAGIEVVDALAIAAGFGGLTALSETLPHVKKVKANSTFQLCFNILKAVLGVFQKKESIVDGRTK